MKCGQTDSPFIAEFTCDSCFVMFTVGEELRHVDALNEARSNGDAHHFCYDCSQKIVDTFVKRR